MSLALNSAQRVELLRWTLSFGVVVALHAGLTLFVLGWDRQNEPPGAPPAAMMIDLAPLPAAPQITPTELPPAPDQTEAALPPEPPPPPPPEPGPIPEPVPEPEPPPPVQPPEDVATKPEEEKRPPAAETAAPQAASEVAAKAAAPLSGVPAPPPSNALPNWQGMLLGHLEQHKRYPRDAQWRRQEGVVYLHFTMDRDGNVLEYRLEKSSGFDTLDAEVLALIERAQPLPPPPDELPGDPLELVVPVQFYLR